MENAASTDKEIPKLEMNDGRKIPAIALGTFLGFDQNGPIKSQGEQLLRAIRWAIDAGYRHFDTAAIYKNEDEVGAGIHSKIKDGVVRREDIFVTTKLWNTDHGKSKVIPALRESLKRLNLTYVDLYLMHWPISLAEDYKQVNIDYLETWRGMQDAQKRGLAKSIGISNFNKEQVKRIIEEANVKPAVLEVEVNPNFTNEELVAYAKSQGLVVMAYSPFGSLVSSRSTADSPPPKLDDPTLLTIAKKYGKTTPQIVLRYLVDRGVIPIPKSVTKSRIEENINIFDFKLTEDEIKTISDFNKNHRIVLPSFWQDHPNYPFEKVDNPISDPF